jgi:hypothetical protein
MPRDNNSGGSQHPTLINRQTSRQNINKDILELNNTVDEMDLTSIWKIFHPTTADYTFFSASHGTFFKIDHILGLKTSLQKYKKNQNNPVYPNRP